MREVMEIIFSSVAVPVHTYPSAEALLESWTPSHRGIVLLDLSLPGMSGLQFLARHVPKPIHLPVVVLTGSADVASAVEAMQSGARDLIEKPVQRRPLLERLAATFLFEHEAWLRAGEASELAQQLSSLTEREREVLNQLAEGLSNRDVGEALGISPRTVEVHRARVMVKTQSDSITDLVNRLWRLGLADRVGLRA